MASQRLAIHSPLNAGEGWFPLAGISMWAHGRTRDTRQSWLAIAKKGNQPTRRLKSFAAIIVSTQTLYAHFELYGKAVHTMHTPWDDGVTLLHRPAAGYPVIADAVHIKRVSLRQWQV